MDQNRGSRHGSEPIGNSGKNRKNPRLPLWATHGLEDVYFQREAQVNFWTVLGGLAMAALLTQLGPLLQELHKSRWHLLLYLVTSILVLANSWVQTSWGSLTLKWTISILSTIIMLFQMLAQSIQCLLITNPSAWFAATAGIILTSLVLQVYFEKSGAWVSRSPETIKRYKVVNSIYLGLVLICLAAAFQLFKYPSPLAETIWGFAALIFAVLALYLEHGTMQEEKKKLGIP